MPLPTVSTVSRSVLSVTLINDNQMHMKYTPITTFMLLALLATGCVQEEPDLLGDVNGGVEWVPLRLEGGEITRLSVSDDTGLISCTEGDQVAVHTTAGEYKTCAVNVSKSTVPVPLGSGESRDGFAVYPASVIANNSASEVQVTYPDSYDLSVYSEDALATLTEAPCPMVAVNTSGKALVFRHVGGLLRITLENVPAGTKTVTVTVMGDPVTGTATVTAPGTAYAYTTIDSDNSEPSGHVVAFTFPGDNGLTSDRTVVLNLPVPSGNYTDALVTVKDTDDDDLLSVRTLKVSSIVAHRTGIKLSRKMYRADPVAPRRFSVSEAKQVFIAPGNLQLMGENTWQFAADPWECFGTSQSDNHRDLFGWGTGDAPNKVSTSYSDYLNFTDWGTNTITNGGGYTWRTLTQDEWEYLFAREGADGGVLWTRATVADVPGIILFPDDFDGAIDGTIMASSYVSVFPVGNVGMDSSYSSYVVSAFEWEFYKLEGCAFLPAAGTRSGANVLSVGEDGCYWSSTAYGGDSAYCMFFHDSVVDPSSLDGLYPGFSVRLVRDFSFEFSVGENKKVSFSLGNLQYIGSASTPYWKFADHQWDVLGTTTGQDSDATNADRDLFGWATSGYNGNYPYLFDDDVWEYGPSIDSGEWTSNSNQWDWGVHNTISNGTSYSWRTLASSEWKYLFDSRTCTPKFAMANVAGVNGLIIFPDDYKHPSYLAAINNTDYDSSGYEDNTFDSTDWSWLESAGCIFLPAAGYRDDTDVVYVGESGFYWSSTASGEYSANALFIESVSVFISSFFREYGCSVRLVRDLGENTQPVVTYGLSISGKDVTGSGPYTLTMESQGGGIVKEIKLTSTMSVDGVNSAAAWTAEYSSNGTSWSGTSPLSGFSVTASGNGSTNGETVTVSMPSGMTDTTVYVRFSNAGTSVVMQVTRHINEPFEFTINAQGDKVSFSPGNLQYIGSASTPFWKFADFQWNYFGDTTGQNSSATNVDRDLFGWGTGGAPNKVSTSGSDYPIFTDWGTNAISNGGDYSWRTLTSSEWQYLFDRYEGTLWAKCTVKGVPGVLLFPDGFDLMVEVDYDNVYVFGGGFGGFDGIPSTPYYNDWDVDDTQWEYFESEGCVFLPAAGFREGTGISDVNDNGYYWSSTALSSLGAYGLYFSNNDTLPSKDGTRKQGYSVRLVRDL